MKRMPAGIRGVENVKAIFAPRARARVFADIGRFVAGQEFDGRRLPIGAGPKLMKETPLEGSEDVATVFAP